VSIPDFQTLMLPVLRVAAASEIRISDAVESALISVTLLQKARVDRFYLKELSQASPLPHRLFHLLIRVSIVMVLNCYPLVTIDVRCTMGAPHFYN